MRRGWPRRRPMAVTPAHVRESGARRCGGGSLHVDESDRPRRVDRGLGVRAVARSRRLAGSAPASRPGNRGRDLAALSEVRARVSCIASFVLTLVSRGYNYAEYKKDLVPGLVAPLQVTADLGIYFRFLEHRADHAFAGIRVGRRAAVLCLHDRGSASTWFSASFYPPRYLQSSGIGSDNERERCGRLPDVPLFRATRLRD